MFILCAILIKCVFLQGFLEFDLYGCDKYHALLSGIVNSCR